MDLIDPIVTIAEKLYSLCSEVKANKQRCQRLASRVSGLVELVQTMKQQGLGNQPKIVERGLRELKLTLESAQEVVKKYISTGFLKLICKAFEFGEEFSSLNERLNDAEQLLSLALQAHQRKRIEDLFEESRRRREDEEDKQRDCQELEKLLRTLTEETKEGISDVKDTVDQTQRDVQEIKVMLETPDKEDVKRPSIHQETIREIRPEELTYDVPIKPIMKSNDSEVFEGEYNKFTVAIKRYTYPLNTNPSEVRKIFSKEVETMRRFESPNILRMFGICVQNENGPNPEYLIVMEFCEKGSLRQVLDSNCRLTWAIKAQMCLDAAQGIYRLHQSEQKFKVHGCINSSKFLVAAGYRVKLGGFELAKTETSLRRTKSGRSSIYYSSPQQLQSIHYSYDKPCEIYSFGIVLWEIATRENPFEGCSRDDVYRKVYTEQIIEPLPQDCPQQLAELINACRSFEPFHRPTAGVLVDKLRKVAEQIKED